MARAAAFLLLHIFVCVSLCFAQGTATWVIDTVAGGAIYDGLPATQTPLNMPNGLWIDRDGALWVADMGNHVIRRMDPATGIMRVVVGGGTILDDAIPVPGLSVRLERPSHLTGDAAGNIYFTDSSNNRVRKLTPDGLVTTVVGTGQAGYAGDGGSARFAKLNAPTGLAFDATGNLFVADAGNCHVRRVDTAGIISTYAGSGQCQTSGDGGPALSAGFASGSFPGGMQGLALDSKGSLYVASDTVRRIERGTGIITTVVGIPNQGSYCSIPDGSLAATSAMCSPISMLFDQQDNLYFTYGPGLAKVDANTGLVTNFGGNWQGAGIARDAAGRWVFAATYYGRILQASAAPGKLAIIAGSNEPFDGVARLAVLSLPLGMATDARGNVYVGERPLGRVRQLDPTTGRITTVLGGGSTPMADGVAATAASLGNMQSIHVDPQGNILFDQLLSLWRMDAQTGKIARVAGPLSWTGGYSGDGGPATQALLNEVHGIVTDAAGNIFISDIFNNRVRRVDGATGIITTVAGNGNPGTSGDNGPGTAAAVGGPQGLAIDRQGQLLIAAGLLRRLNLSTGIITAVQARSQPGGPLGNVGVSSAVTVDKDNNIFLVDWGGTVQEIRASDNVLLTVAGSTQGFFGDGGVAALARLSLWSGAIVADPSGNIYVADALNGRVRKLSLALVQPEMVVSPTTLFFNATQGSPFVTAQQFNIAAANSLPFNWTLEIATSAGGNWLTASKTSGTAPATILLTVDASKLGAGSYRGTVTVKSAVTSNPLQTADVLLTVQGAVGASLGLSQQYLNFQAVAGGANPAQQVLSISNVGSGTLSWSATAETSSGGQWLRISPSLGTAPSTLTASVDIAGLAQGVYQGQVLLRNLTGSETKIISVVLTVTKTQPILLPTQTGFLFTGVEGSLVIGPQSFAIQNAGQGKLDWQIGVNMPGGGDWLRISPLSGTSDATQPLSALTPVTLQVDPGRLKAGVSVALLTITATGALNSPQTAIVLVNMLARGTPPVAMINPLGLIFTAGSGTTTALAQGITIASTGGQALQFLARTRTQAGGGWLSVTPEQGVLLSSAESVNLSVQANAMGLAPGVYFGTVTLSFGTGASQEIAVALVVSPVAASDANQAYDRQPDTWHLTPGTSSAACAPRRMVIVETKLGNRFSLQSGWPIPMLVQAADDCGMTVTNATVVASFTSGDPPVVFQNLKNGQYTATWVPATQGSLGVTVRAVSSGLEDGVFQFAGTLGQASTLPLIYRDGWVNAASFAPYKPLAPGMIFSLFGSNLAEGRNLASQIPLPRTLGNIKATIGGYEAPLFYADGGQVNAQVPFELTPGVATLVVTGKDSAGAPGTVTIVNAQPGVFTVSQSGTGQGVVLDALNNLVDSNHAVKAGEAVVIYATGLGATNPPVATGQAAPAVPPLALVTTPVKVTIGGVDAAVEFAGLAPGFVGLYQVNARVPAGVTAGNAVALVLTQNGVASNTVTIAVK